jgi:hypothetical protein
MVEFLKDIKQKIKDYKNTKNTDCLKDLECNSGFSKIYSLYIDDFIIYDSRVAAALCYLIKLFCDEKGKSIPNDLMFEIPESKPSKSDPDRRIVCGFNFITDEKNYLLWNIKASNLLKEVLKTTKSKFNKIPQKERLRALEAALFMIGYKVT